MLKAARAGSSAPSVPAHPRLPKHGHTPRPLKALLIGALVSFGLGLMLAGAAGCIAVGAPLPPGLGLSATVATALAVACCLAGLGMLLALRERALREGQHRRATRAERIQQELDDLSLTPKEMPVAKLILQHKSYPEIAAERHLSVRTVQFHATNIFRKAYVSNRRDFERIILTDEPAGCTGSRSACQRAARQSDKSALAQTETFSDNGGTSAPPPPPPAATSAHWFSARLSGCPSAARSRFSQHHDR